MKLPNYVEKVLAFVGEKESKDLGTDPKVATDRLRKELIDESLTAKNPGPRDGSKKVVASVSLEKNPWPITAVLPEGFEPDFRKWNFELKTQGFTDQGLTIQLVVKDGFLEGMAPSHTPKVGQWFTIGKVERWLGYDYEPGNVIPSPKEAKEAFGNLRNGNAVFREIIEKGLKAENFVPKTYATETAGGTFQLCVGCRRKWMGVPKGKLPEPLMSNRCPKHDYMAEGCECEHESHFNKEERAEAKKESKTMTEEVAAIVKRMDAGERVRLSKESATSVFAHLYSAKPPRGDDVEIWEDEPGYVRIFFKGVPLAKSGLLSKGNPMSELLSDEETNEVLKMMWRQSYEERNPMANDILDYLGKRYNGFKGWSDLRIDKLMRDLNRVYEHVGRKKGWPGFRGTGMIGIGKNNPWPQDNQIPADFKPNFKNWLDWRKNDSFCLNTKAKFEDHPQTEETICVTDGRMSFIYPFTHKGPRGCPDTDHDWIHLSVEKNVLHHADDEKKIIKDPYGGGELIITNWRAIMRELIEKGMAQEGYVMKSNPTSGAEAGQPETPETGQPSAAFKQAVAKLRGGTPSVAKKNPTNPRQKELSAFGKAFMDSSLGEKVRGLSGAKREEAIKEMEKLYRDIEIMADKYSDLILTAAFGLKVKRTKEDPEPTALEDRPGMSELQVRERVMNRYLKLDIQMWVITLLVKIADFSKDELERVTDALEGRKTLKELQGRGNRLANATVMFNLIGSAMLDKVDPKHLLLAIQNAENKKKIASIYKAKAAEAKELAVKEGKRGAEIKQKEIAEAKLEIEFTPEMMERLGMNKQLTPKEEAARKELLGGLDPALLARGASTAASEGASALRQFAEGLKDPKKSLGFKQMPSNEILIELLKTHPQTKDLFDEIVLKRIELENKRKKKGKK